MGYHFSVWDGQTPSSDRDAHRIWLEVFREAHPRVEPTPVMAEFLARLLQRWPIVDGQFGEDAPWKWSDMHEDVAGRVADFDLTFGSAPTAVPIIAAMAEEMGLVWWDPQVRELRVMRRQSWEDDQIPPA